MRQNFLACDRDQALLLPPSLRGWLPVDHLAWLVLEAVEEFDLSVFYGAYREDGLGRAAFAPAMMVALLVCAYAIGCAVLTRDRAPLLGGARLSGDRGQSGAWSRQDRALSVAA